MDWQEVPEMIVGIDPGLSGAMFFMVPGDSTGEAIDLPVHVLTRGGKQKRELDIVQLIQILALRRLTHAFAEQVGAMPGQGVSSTFAFGKTFGIILGVIAARSIPLTLVPPVRWKRAMGVTKSKDGCRARASQLLPEAAHQWPLRRHDGRAEAALIALYGAGQMQGTVCQNDIGCSTTSSKSFSSSVISVRMPPRVFHHRSGSKLE
jgi:crossover junction endodeoxyribonuclease RuvC